MQSKGLKAASRPQLSFRGDTKAAQVVRAVDESSAASSLPEGCSAREGKVTVCG